jgi:serine/threonine protein phosphatase PrpC
MASKRDDSTTLKSHFRGAFVLLVMAGSVVANIRDHSRPSSTSPLSEIDRCHSHSCDSQLVDARTAINAFVFSDKPPPNDAVASRSSFTFSRDLKFQHDSSLHRQFEGRQMHDFQEDGRRSGFRKDPSQRVKRLYSTTASGAANEDLLNMSKDKEELIETGIQIGCASLGGTDPDRPQKVNQDAFFTFNSELWCGDSNKRVEFVLAGVMDGHGTKGHLVTRYLKEQFPRRFQQLVEQWNSSHDKNGNNVCLLPNQDDQELLGPFLENLHRLGHYFGETCGEEVDPASLTIEGMSSISSSASIDKVMTQVLQLVFVLAHLDACQKEGVPAGRSGTTCVVCAIGASDGNKDELPRKIYSAHVGDSRAIIGCPSLSSDNKEGTNAYPFQGKSLTTETTISLQPRERQRIESTADGDGDGGKIVGTNVFYGPVGIAMTRALGDAVMLRAGVVPVPQISIRDLEKKNDSIIVLGSDGIFDVLPNDLVISHVQDAVRNGTMLDKAAEELTRLAEEKWSDGLPIDVKSDDMTCVILRT